MDLQISSRQQFIQITQRKCSHTGWITTRATKVGQVPKRTSNPLVLDTIFIGVCILLHFNTYEFILLVYNRNASTICIKASVLERIVTGSHWGIQITWFTVCHTSTCCIRGRFCQPSKYVLWPKSYLLKVTAIANFKPPIPIY